MACVLVIDNEKQVRSLLRVILEREGHDVYEAKEGETALALYRAHPCDVIITDIFMPEQDGLSFIQNILKEFPTARVIAISGQAKLVQSCDIFHMARRLGARQCLEKPFNLKDLVYAINQEIEGAGDHHAHPPHFPKPVHSN